MNLPAAIVWILAAALPGVAMADPDKDESGKGRGKERKVEFWDGHCKVEQKWEKNGEYKEKRKCKGHPAPESRQQHSAREQRAAPAPRPQAQAQAQPLPVPLPVPVPAAPVPAPAAPPSAAVLPPPWIIADRGSVAYHPAYQPGPAESEAMRCENASISQALGSLVGGTLGAQIGSANARTAMPTGGTAAGVLVEGRFGRRIDEADQACMAQVLEFAPDGHKVQWGGLKGAQLAVTPGQPQQQRGSYCRRYTLEVHNGQGWDKAAGSACRRPDGAWISAREPSR